MKKVSSLVLALLASLCSLSIWADRVAPTIPSGVAPQSGQTYYLYNLDASLFLSSYNTVGDPALNVLVTVYDDGSFIFKNGSSENYIGKTGNGNMTTWGSATDRDNYWVVASSQSGYTIQCSPLNTSYYAEGQFLGTVEGSNTLMYNRASEDQIHWLFIPADEAGNHFVAEMKLYRALCALDGLALPSDLTAHFESLYSSRANQTAELLTNTATEVRNCSGMSQGYIAPYWNEYPILWTTSVGSFGQDAWNTWALPDHTTDINGNYIYHSSGRYFQTLFYPSEGNRTLSATVNVDELSTFIYSTSGTDDHNCKIQVYVDDVLVRTLTGPQINYYPTSKTYARFFEVLQPGTHTIKWVATNSNSNNNSSYFYIHNTGVVKSPLITVSLLEPGSLGTEVLYNTDHIKNVRRLKVKGKMNSDDWAKMKMMSGLLDLDLSEAEFTEVPEGQFRVTDNDTVMQFLHRLILPEGVTKINKEAFYWSFIDTLTLPSTLKNIRENAFCASHIQEINMPDDCTEIYGDENSSNGGVFGNMRWLRKLKCAKNWAVIPKWTFGSCYFLEEVTLPEKLEAIGYGAFDYDRYITINFPDGLKRINDNAFYCCYNANFGAFPEGLEQIGRYAFSNCYKIVDLVVPQKVSYLGYNAFEYCYNMKTAELGVSQYALTDRIFYSCNSLTTLRLNSPTVATVNKDSYYYPVEAGRLKEVDLIVPSFLVNAYKLDKYWYNFKSITGFSTAEIQDWTINNPLVMNHDRFEGNPNIAIAGDYDRMPSLKFNGTAAQSINNLKLQGSHPSYKYKNYPGQIYSNCSNISVNGDVQVDLYTEAKRWYFFSLPFDVKVSDITHQSADVQCKIGYYDGADRALYGTNGSWKDVKGQPVENTDDLDVTTMYTETSNTPVNRDYRYYIQGASFIIGENDEVDYGTTSYNGVQYVRLNTDKDNQIKIRVNEGYMVTDIAITAFSDNWSTTDRSIALTGAYIDGSFSSVLSENVIFPNGRGESTATATLEDINATKLVRLTFDNSLIVDYNEDSWGCSKRIYAQINVTYKRVVPEDEEMAVIPAGTGFIMQTNKDTWNFFHAVDNAMKQNIVSYNEFVKPLEVNPSEKKANTGWNLVGNPYQCFYNSHCLNFTAPITVWDASDRKYVAYSITDDDYAIRPNEAFFVQCPNTEYNTIGFPLQGRQFTDVVESMNAVKAKDPQALTRLLLDVELSDGTLTDNTRFVLNSKAQMAYELDCDASKFMSMDASVPQIYTIEQGEQMAINERPMSDGIVRIGFKVAVAGRYTLSAPRCQFTSIMLVDNETGEETELANGDSYSFSTNAGTFNSRFSLRLSDSADGIEIVQDASSNVQGGETYDLGGRRVIMNGRTGKKGIYIVNGKKVIK